MLIVSQDQGESSVENEWLGQKDSSQVDQERTVDVEGQQSEWEKVVAGAKGVVTDEDAAD